MAQSTRHQVDLDQIVREVEDHVLRFLSAQLENYLDQSYLLAISGGADSMVLLEVCRRLQLDIYVAHCQFGLRPEAPKEAELVATYSKDYNIPYFQQYFDTLAYASERGISVQMAARDLRYSWFEELRQKHDLSYLCTAHHLDDDIETMLIMLLRGSGLAGAKGIAPSTPTGVLRPLLAIPKSSILDYAQARGLAWIEDSSNSETKYQRNAIRLGVLPALESHFPDYRSNLGTSLEHLKSDWSLLQRLVEEKRSSLLRHQDNRTVIERAKMLSGEDSVRLMDLLLRPYGFSSAQARSILDPDIAVGSLFYSQDHILLVDRTALIIERSDGQVNEDKVILSIDMKMDKKYDLPSGARLSIRSTSPAPKDDAPQIGIDPDRVRWPLGVRYWRAGDYFYPVGMGMKRQKIKKFFANNKIDRMQKSRVPLLVDADDRIVWVVGWRADERFVGQGCWVIYKPKDEGM